MSSVSPLAADVREHPEAPLEPNGRARRVGGPGLRYVGARLAGLVVLLLLLSLGTYALLDASPGSTERLLLGNHPQTPAAVAAVRAEYHLGDPFFVRYGKWLEGVAHFDFGTSIRTGEQVTSAVGRAAAITLTLGAISFLLVLAIGVPLGMWAAVRRGGRLDRAIVGGSVMAVSAPPFATGVVLLYLLAVLAGLFPAAGAGTGVTDRLWHLALPALALALTAIATIVRMTRTAVVRELEQDYVMFARARGLSERRVLWRYVMRNASIPVLTASGLVLGYMVGGAVLVEVAFSIPGLGSLLVDSVNYKDLPMLQGAVLTIATAVLLINLTTDVLYMVIDPRVRLGGRRRG